MAKLDGLEIVLDFLQGLQPKIVAQIAKKIVVGWVEARNPTRKMLLAKRVTLVGFPNVNPTYECHALQCTRQLQHLALTTASYQFFEAPRTKTMNCPIARDDPRLSFWQPQKFPSQCRSPL